MVFSNFLMNFLSRSEKYHFKNVALQTGKIKIWYKVIGVHAWKIQFNHLELGDTLLSVVFFKTKTFTRDLMD